MKSRTAPGPGHRALLEIRWYQNGWPVTDLPAPFKAAQIRRKGKGASPQLDRIHDADYRKRPEPNPPALTISPGFRCGGCAWASAAEWLA